MSTRSLQLLAVIGFGLNAYAQTQQGQFNQVININGDVRQERDAKCAPLMASQMQINSVTFPDNTKIETFSQTQKQMIVNQNTAPLPGNQVTGSTGQPFIALAQNSITVQTNDASDLVGGQVELAMNTQMMQQNGINPDNTFVGKLSNDRRTWMVMETIRSVNM